MMQFKTHPDAARRRQSAIAAAKAILGLDLYGAHKRELLRACIWKLTEAEGNHKHRTRYRTRAALDTVNVEHEHVVQQRFLIEALLRHPEAADELLECAVACTVTTAEHLELTRLSRERPEIDGWQRYLELARSGGLIVVNTADESEPDLEALAIQYSHPLLNEARRRAVAPDGLRELLDALNIAPVADSEREALTALLQFALRT